jgi:acyl-coenzyme A synthetase/AMP-(fatty) acid ligase
MIRMGNTSDYALLFFGAIAAGCVPLPSSAQLTEEEAAFLLADSGARLLAVADELSIQPPPGVQVLGMTDVAALRVGHEPLDYADTAAADPAFLIYTSGTTGQPKGVLHAQRSAWGRRPMYQGWYGIRPDDVILHAGAFNWTYTLGVGLTDPWANGATAVLYNGPRDVTVWPTLMEKYRATLFAAVPGLYRQILKYNDLRAYDLSSLRHGLTAGEALSTALLEQMADDDRQGAVRGVGDERMLDLHLFGAERAGQARQSGQGPAGSLRGGVTGRRRRGTAAAGRNRTAGGASQRSGVDAGLLESSRGRGAGLSGRVVSRR